MNKRVLIISNNCLSTTSNNGKTILSLFDCLDNTEVSQLYFSNDLPSVPEFNYFQLTDIDILHGKFGQKYRGRKVNSIEKLVSNVATEKIHGDASRIIREIAWFNSWKSTQLDQWLDNISPTHIFFVGGDCCFAFSIFRYIVKKYDAFSAIYITDDYYINRKNDNFISRYRRSCLKKSMIKSLKDADCFYTISQKMKKKYLEVFGRDSMIISNMVDVVDMEVNNKEKDNCEIIYAGSLYYGRDDSLLRFAEKLSKYNVGRKNKINISIYGSCSDIVIRKFTPFEFVQFHGLLSKEDLLLAIAQTDFLLFMESFEEKMIEKVEYSFSTKIPEYLSSRKPIIAIGPSNVSSIEYLSDVALCVNEIESDFQTVIDFIENKELQETLAHRAFMKYMKNHKKVVVQNTFMSSFLR